MSSPSITFFDIESSPLLGYTWGTWETDVIATKESWFMLSFAYKIGGDDQIHVKSLPDYKGYKRDKHNDKKLVKDLWEVLDKSDIVCAHNGDKFDIRKANARFIYHGLNPPSPYKTIDTLKIARKYFKFDSNKLTDLSEFLKIGTKLPTEGFRHTWLECMSGNPRAWKIMCRYNEHDVWLLEQVYRKLKSWHSRPAIHWGVAEGRDKWSCPECGSEKINKTREMISSTGNSSFQMHCRNCGRYYNITTPVYKEYMNQ